jgi:hypothetical protein
VLTSLDMEFAQPKLHNCRSSDLSVGKRLFSNIEEWLAVGCTNRIKRLSIGINNWILTKDLSLNK